MPDDKKLPKGTSSMTIESGPGLPPIEGEPKRKEKLKMPAVPDMSKRLGPKLTRASGRGRVRRSSRQRA